MFSISKKAFVIMSIIAVLAVFAAGCYNLNKPNNNAGSVPQGSAQTLSSPSPQPGKANEIPTSAPSDSSKALLTEMMQLAKQGKVIGCEFAAKTAIFENITAKWGSPDKTEWVALAKGTYADYSKQKMVFGFNKGMQIFEVRTFDSRLGKISLSKAEEVFGKAQYTNQSNGEKIIGYTAGDEFKMLLVFTNSTDAKTEPILDHYSVLYPRGTENSMANDPGRQW